MSPQLFVSYLLLAVFDHSSFATQALVPAPGASVGDRVFLEVSDLALIHVI